MTVDRRSLAELRATIERRDKRIAALEAELERQKQTTVWTLDRAEQAEADLAAWRAFCDEWVDIAFEVQQQDHKRYTQAEAEVALRDQMLHAIWLGHKKWKVPTADTEDEWLADLRARAEKEAER